jgi:hypothetical protein
VNLIRGASADDDEEWDPPIGRDVQLGKRLYMIVVRESSLIKSQLK